MARQGSTNSIYLAGASASLRRDLRAVVRHHQWPVLTRLQPIAGTILEQSKKPLVLWFRAIFEVTASKQGVSAAELQRKLGLGS